MASKVVGRFLARLSISRRPSHYECNYFTRSTKRYLNRSAGGGSSSSPQAIEQNRPISVNRLVDYLRLLSRIPCLTKTTSVDNLFDQADSLDGLQLNELLRYEADPISSRRVQLQTSAVHERSSGQNTDYNSHKLVVDSSWEIDSAAQRTEGVQRIDQGNGILSLSYIVVTDQNEAVNRKQTEEKHVITCTGFLIETQDSGDRILVTCAHTLWESKMILSKKEAESPNRDFRQRTRSGCLARDQQGNVFMVTQVIGGLASADLLFLKIIKLPSLAGLSLLAQELARDKSDIHLLESFHSLAIFDRPQEELKRYKTLPVSPYPPQGRSPVSIPQLNSSDDVDCLFEWEIGHVIEYKDTMGVKVTAGSYDPLNTILISTVPNKGSSGGPIINENGAVIGLVRGFQMAYDQKRTIGFGAVSERFWELFQLPGIRSSSPPPSSKDD
ncbi:hypothetical protein MJO28_016567 [Puccinia striiformis f. sp. tritici]|nr:hypothetical protein Pst134EA_030350 [Puccinia striiformis f. sp. tritici]KAI9599932.1 hypothetical protein KEM48_000040 [Puccinia striiformis f. sp. tritici PST-130]KNF03025.1 hypothetical protein PSTG_03620 [Puccinia striiformis f. sp. tritici PST-78]KAH9440266.1 hypothetical protein Pst134EB_030887 [Puccinia striiformis f. sp. tritici]KAH9446433.1 hypothetical protein Pst134EA_030350 [Puccinia striiformis f. sp. tritici]KAI7934807.1 hypothetical protein MJO29_016070 [Puccinia striiformis